MGKHHSPPKESRRDQADVSLEVLWVNAYFNDKRGRKTETANEAFHITNIREPHVG